LIVSGFQEEKLGEAQPPAVHYRLVSGETGFYAEFLTPLEGNEYKRGGRRDATTRIAGVSSQKLRHIDLLLRTPWAVEIGATNGYPTAETRRVQLPTPASFLAQKILIHHKRDLIGRAKDVLYLHDTIETFGGALPAIREEWETNVKPGLHRNAIRQVEKAADVLFAEVDDTIREAARIALGRKLTPESIRELCSYGWNQLFS
jgi:Nucleotidyltransferase